VDTRDKRGHDEKAGTWFNLNTLLFHVFDGRGDGNKAATVPQATGMTALPAKSGNAGC